MDTVAVAVGVTKVSEEGAEWDPPMEGVGCDMGTLVGWAETPIAAAAAMFE